jgi:hypothetical protein
MRHARRFTATVEENPVLAAASGFGTAALAQSGVVKLARRREFRRRLDADDAPLRSTRRAISASIVTHLLRAHRAALRYDSGSATTGRPTGAS